MVASYSVVEVKKVKTSKEAAVTDVLLHELNKIYCLVNPSSASLKPFIFPFDLTTDNSPKNTRS